MKRRSLVTLAIAAGFIALVFWSLTGVEPVKVLDTELRRADSQVYVAGRVENTGQRTESVDLEVRYYGVNGRQVGTSRLSIDDLKSGEMRRFSMPKEDFAGVSEFSIYLNHGRNPYGN